MRTSRMAMTACLHPYQTPLTLIAWVRSQIFSSVLTASSSLRRISGAPEQNSRWPPAGQALHSRRVHNSSVVELNTSAWSDIPPTPHRATSFLLRDDESEGGLTNTSSLPHLATAFSTNAFTSASLLTSHLTPSASEPGNLEATSSAALVTASTLMSERRTRAPSEAN
jgi:hypothetical protein